jgi:beta-N-acetylglucosaminidase
VRNINIKVTKLLLFAFLVTILIGFNNGNAVANTGSLPAKGYIDTPASNAKVKGDMEVKGWFLDGSGVAKIEVLVDGKVIGQAQYGLERLDVKNAFPEYQNANSGYRYTLDTRKLSNGSHSVTVRETGKNGATKVLPSRSINVQNLPTRGYMDAPVNGSTIKGDTVVHGWLLDENGVTKVEVLVDGKIVGQAEYGRTRLDVQRAYPEYQNANSGFKYTLNTRTLSNGTHSVTVRGTTAYGTVKSLNTATVNVQNTTLAPRGYLDAPADQSVLKGDAQVSGWFLDADGVSKVEVLVDGKVVGQAQYGRPRLDVHKAYPGYENANSGFLYFLNTKNISNGTHTLTVRGISTKGSVTDIKTISVNVQNPNLIIRGTIDGPKDASVIKGNATVDGWILDGDQVAKVEVLADGNVVGQAQYGIARPDVHTAYPEYNNPNAGFEYTLNTNNLSNGNHSVSVRETNKSGNTKVIRTITVNVQNPTLPTKGSIDGLTNGTVLKGEEVISGWALDGSGISRVDVLIDGKVKGQAQYGGARPDVLNAYPEYQNFYSGYSYTLNTQNLNNGSHSLTVRATTNSGSVKDLHTVTVNVQNPNLNLETKGSIDSPTNGSTIKDDTIVRGWVLDGTGVSKVEVLVDGLLKGQAEYGISRPDVLTAYPEYQNANSGYQFILNTRTIVTGEHTLTVKVTRTNGTTYTMNNKVTVNNGSPYMLINLKKPANITAADIVDFFNRRSPYSPLKNFAQDFIDAQNKYGVNAQYLVAHAIWETGWGGSDLRNYKHNLYGYGAYDVCPFTCGYYFPSGAASIDKVAYQVRRDYLDPTGAYYYAEYGPTLVGMNVRYATDQNWKNGIANLMESIKPYNESYYSSRTEAANSGAVPPVYGRDIPDGQAYPTNTVLSFPSGVTAKVNTNVNFRSLPYVSASTLISTVSQNTVVTVLGYNTDVRYTPGGTGSYAYRWYRVSVNGQKGWLNGEYIDIANLLQVNVSGTLNIRNVPSTDNSTVLASVANGTFLKPVLNNGAPVIQNGWHNVYLPNSTTTGWVSRDFVIQILH